MAEGTLPPADPVELLARLVAFDTVSAKPNRELIDWIAGYLAAFGVAAEIVPGPDGKASLHAVIGPRVDGGVVLSGHTDVVPVEGQAWSTDPFTLTERNGRLYGRGSADMKGFVALVLSLVPEMVASPLARPIHLAFSHDEEVGCLGAPRLLDHIAERSPTPRIAVVGEPTMLKPCDAHKGIEVFRTTVTGREAHSSAPDAGASAIVAASSIVGFIAAMAAEKRKAPLKGSRFDPPFTTFNVGTIAGGGAVNIIPRSCELVWEFRAAPGDDPEAILVRLEGHVRDVVLPALTARHPGGSVTTERLVAVPPLGSNPEDGHATALARQWSGANETGTVAFTTEGGLYQRAGFSTVVCGPGDIAQAHQPDEFISLDQMRAGEAFLRRIVGWAVSPS